MKTPRFLLAFVFGLSSFFLHGQFVAFNDHDGWQSAIHPFTTTYSFDDYSQTTPNVAQGRLRNITDGEFVEAQVRIEYVGLSLYTAATNGNTFAPGTPAALIFGCQGDGPCFADFRDSGERVAGSRSVLHTFLGLNPARKYQFIGTGVGTSPVGSISNDTTRYTISGALSYVNAHTTNCVLDGYAVTNVVIVPTGRNHEPGFGDMAVWNDIRVGSDGTFTVESSGNYGLGSPINGFRLVEDFVEPTPPFVSKQAAAHVNASRNSAQRLAPKVAGSLPLSFQWHKGSTPLPGQTNRVLTFAALQPEDAGTYWLAATNPYGAVVTSNVNVVVQDDPVTILASPQHQSLRYSDPLYLSATVTGTHPIFYQWFKDGVPVANATSNILFIGAAGLTNAGAYSLLASNLFSSSLSQTAAVTVAASPLRILEEPLSQTVTQGATLRLQVAVAGSQPCFYWIRNGVALTNTSSVVRIAFANTNHAGDYFAIITGLMNTVTTAVATVTIVPPTPPPPPPPGLFSLFPLTNEWAYDQSAAELGTAWRDVDYDDSAWLRGRGVHAIDFNPLVTPFTNTVLRLTTDSGVPIITSYFRTHFFWPTSSVGAVLLFSNLIDDGAIFYLNGVPLFRHNMPPGPVTSSALAPDPNPGGEGVFFLTNVPAPMIVEGDNVLAVEVHQNSPLSSDIVFGTAVFGYNEPEQPLSIVASPQSVTVLEGQPFELNFTLNAPARFQWHHQGLPVNAPAGSSFFVGSARPSDSGEYFAIATNSLGAVTSAVAVVDVVADTEPPRVLSAILETNRTNVLVQFAERLAASTASNAMNYRLIFSDGAEAATIVSASYSNQRVSLSLSLAPPPGTNLVLELDGVTDLAVASNQLDAVLVPVRQHVLLVPLTGEWKYNDTGADLGMAWREPAYDDSLWLSGAALLYNDHAFGEGDIFPPPPPPLLVTNTWIQLTNDGIAIATHYFRRPVEIAGASLLGAQLSLQTMIDDGAVLYLNGAEFFRIGVTNDPLSGVNRASRSRNADTEGTPEGPFRASPANMVSGTNVLAVEVHQLALADMSFGAEVSLLAKSFNNEPVRILRQPAEVSVREGEPFTFEVESIAAARAQWHKNGPSIPGATGESLTVSRAALSDDGSHFHVVLSNAFSYAMSQRARLNVIADTNPPALLSARAGTSLTEITLSFSEPVAPASASNLGQYAVRDSSGQLVAVNGAMVVNETNIVLTTAPRLAGRNYEVRVEGVRDIAAASNEIEPGSGARLGYEHVLVPLAAIWACDQSGNGQVETWKHVAFDDGEWPRGEASLFHGAFAAVLPGTWISMTNADGARVITHYFRHEFNLPPLDSGAMLSLRHAVDDGAVIYLNGAPIERRNIAPGAIDVATLATGAGDGALTPPMPVEFIGPPGNAVLAAEVHQFSAFSSDVAFAAELSVVRESSVLPPIGPTLRVSREGLQLRLSWSGGGYLLETAPAVNGVWSAVEGASSPLVIDASDEARFYRLRQP